MAPHLYLEFVAATVVLMLIPMVMSLVCASAVPGKASAAANAAAVKVSLVIRSSPSCWLSA